MSKGLVSTGVNWVDHYYRLDKVNPLNFFRKFRLAKKLREGYILTPMPDYVNFAKEDISILADAVAILEQKDLSSKQHSKIYYLANGHELSYERTHYSFISISSDSVSDEFDFRYNFKTKQLEKATYKPQNSNLLFDILGRPELQALIDVLNTMDVPSFNYVHPAQLRYGSTRYSDMAKY